MIVITAESLNDETFTWIDHVTGKAYLLNVTKLRRHCERYADCFLRPVDFTPDTAEVLVRVNDVDAERARAFKPEEWKLGPPILLHFQDGFSAVCDGAHRLYHAIAVQNRRSAECYVVPLGVALAVASMTKNGDGVHRMLAEIFGP